jgi:hypothetical protein
MAVDLNAETPKRRASWEAMKLDEVGRLSEVIRQGGGKLTPPGGDPGESRKQGPVG